jgi:hypothetical protein
VLGYGGWFGMFLSELAPLMKELTQQPLAFCGGFVSGLLRLSLSEEPARSWLAKHGGGQGWAQSAAPPSENGAGPQSISID